MINMIVISDLTFGCDKLIIERKQYQPAFINKMQFIEFYFHLIELCTNGNA